jgi:integrase
LAVKIKKEPLKDGTVVWRARGVSTGKNPVTGHRAQRTITGATKREVEAELSKIGYQISNRTYKAPWHGLVPELIDSYLEHGAIEWEANTRLSYANALLPAREFFRYHKARDVTREQVQGYRDFVLTSGRRRGGAPGTGLSPRSVNLALQQLQSAYDLAELDGKVAHNPVRHVKRVKSGTTDHETWNELELGQFIGIAALDRLYVVMLLALLGLRRAEILGLQWSDISYELGTITIARSRVLVNARVIEKSPKSRRSARVLPLFEPVTGALRALHKVQAAEKLAAGVAYTDSGYVACDELGAPLHPERLSDEFARLAELAHLRKIRLHDTRATMNTILEQAGVAETLRAAWFGHTIAVNRNSYLGAPRPEELSAISDRIGPLFRAV